MLQKDIMIQSESCFQKNYFQKLISRMGLQVTSLASSAGWKDRKILFSFHFNGQQQIFLIFPALHYPGYQALQPCKHKLHLAGTLPFHL